MHLSIREIVVVDEGGWNFVEKYHEKRLFFLAMREKSKNENEEVISSRFYFSRVDRVLTVRNSSNLALIIEPLLAVRKLFVSKLTKF